jgi:N-acyl-D-aspartate/D-glutamate deacylase
VTDRGILRPGFFADVTVFNPATIHDVATFTDPNHYSTGVNFVLVNGRIVVRAGKITDERPGRALRHQTPPK